MALISDNFNRANTTLAADSPAWPVGTRTSLEIVSNQLANSTNGGTIHFNLHPTALDTAKHYAKFTITQAASTDFGDFVGVAVRVEDAGGGEYSWYDVATDGRALLGVELYVGDDYIVGAYHNGLTISAGDEFAVYVDTNGSSHAILRVYQNGTLITGYDDVDGTIFTESSSGVIEQIAGTQLLTGTGVGVFGFTDVAPQSVRADDFEAADYTSLPGEGGGADIAGTASGTSTVSGILKGRGALRGTSSGTSTVAGSLTGRVALSGSAAGTSTVSGAIRGRGYVAGTLAGTSTVSGVLKGRGRLTGTAAGTSTVSGALSLENTLRGSVAGTSTVSGNLKGRGYLRGSTDGLATVSGTLKGRGYISGSAAGTSTVSGALVQPGGISGTVSGTSQASGTLKGRGRLSGSAEGTSSVSGRLTQPVTPEGSIDGASSYTINAAYGSVMIYHRGDRKFFTLSIN